MNEQTDVNKIKNDWAAQRLEEADRIRKAIESTLYYKVTHEVALTEEEKRSLFELVASGCRRVNRERLYRVIFHYGIHNHPGIYERVHFENGIAHYYAGQSYPDEIRTLRECILTAW